MALMSSPLDSKLGLENHEELISSEDEAIQRSKLAIYMNSGEGPQSYAQNSGHQRGVIDVAKPILEEEITTKLDIKQILSTSPNTFCIADFGCSTGHNSFPAMQIITEAIEKKFQTEGLFSQIPDFQVFFTDQVMNDFNTLFHSLPPQRHYHSAGVPGSFHGRLLPKASLHFAYSSFSLNWLSEVPKAVEDPKSPAWNKGKVHYMGSTQEVFDAYSSQYAKDIDSFLEARAQELVNGGLMALFVPGFPTHITNSNPTDMGLIASSLMDMAKKGRVSEAKVDSFNFPWYFTTPEEFKAIIDRNRNYSIERMENLNNPGKVALTGANNRASSHRAAIEGVLIDHFGNEIMDELFDRYTKKLEATPFLLDPKNDKLIIISVLLKRKVE